MKLNVSGGKNLLIFYDIHFCQGHIQGEQTKNLLSESAISQLKNHRNLKVLVPTQHNTQVIMWVRDKNFQVAMIF